MPTSIRPGDELAGRYHIEDLLDERDGGRFYRAWDRVLARHVAVHVIAADDDRAEPLREAARRSVGVQDPRVLRVLDANETGGVCFVVNEWGSGRSLDIILADEGPLGPRRAAWLVSELAATIALAHDNGVAHGRLVPENVLIDQNGQVRVIGLAVDAALHGLPSSRASADVTDLGGNLYAALTGRWAGVSQSSLAPAHLDGSRVLRPRQVRAGIPRELDRLCDDLLNNTHHGPADASAAHTVHEVLRDFVGDCAGMEAREAARAAAAALPPHAVSLPALPADGHGDPEDPDGPEEQENSDVHEAVDAGTNSDTDADTRGDTEPTVRVSPDNRGAGQPESSGNVDIPTQAGLPVFHDDAEEVGWFSGAGSASEPARKPPPPPELEDPEPKPLFAPEPDDGRPVRTPRPGSVVADGPPDHVPWDSSGAAVFTGTGAGTGTGAVPAYVDDEVPGRNWLRLAMVLGVITLLLVAAIFTFNIGGGRSLVLGDADPDAGDSSAETGEVLTGLEARDIDPQGSPPRRENPDTVGNTVDGDEETSWTTLTYNENFGPGGLKTGLGVVVDLGQVRAPQTVEVTVPDDGTTAFTLYFSNQRPSFVRGLTRAARRTGSGTIEVPLNGSDRGRYLVVWLTSLPGTSDGRFQGEIMEIRVTA